jgi:hypothetical protein
VRDQTLIIEPSTHIKQTFLQNQPFTVTYDRSIQGVPETVLTIPYLVCISPLLWLSGKTYTIDQMDYDTYYALEQVKRIFKKFYPRLSFKGTLTAHKLILNKPPTPRSKSHLAVLFSGGLGSSAASLGLMGYEQLLITNQGVDMPLKNPQLFHTVQEQCRTFAQAYGHTNVFISCNFCTILNYEYLKVFSPKITTWWWLNCVTDALNHTGITAPLLYSLGYTDLYIAASHTVEYPYPYGSHPLIDNELCFAGVQVHHYQEELDRCQKIELISSVCNFYQLPLPALQVCWKDSLGYNCLSCEKCLRTLNNIMVTGSLPFDFGFDITLQEARHLTRTFLSQDTIASSKIFWEWSVIQKVARTRLSAEKLSDDEYEYLSWLATVKLDKKHAQEIHKEDGYKKYFAWLWEQRSFNRFRGSPHA